MLDNKPGQSDDSNISDSSADISVRHRVSQVLPLFDDFLLFLKTNRYSSETLYNYERDLLTFARYLSDSNIPFEKVDKKHVAYYKAYLLSQDRVVPLEGLKKQGELSGTSINRMLSVIRTYLKYLIDMDQSVPVAPESVKLVKTIRQHPKIAEMSELIKLIEAPTHLEKDPRAAARNRAMLETLFATGMRISELVSLSRDQLDDTGRIFILGKGKKERFVYLTDRARHFIDAYLRLRDDRLQALFIPYKGRGVVSAKKRISTNYLQERIKLYRRQLRINVPISAHTLRHGFATYLAESGANPAAIQILLGHESLDTTTRYVHTSDRYAEETHHKYHPLKDVR